MDFQHADILFIDFETTGSAKENANLPWQLGAIRMVNGEILPQQGFSLLLKVPEEHRFNPYSPGRWASIRHQLAQSPSLQELWPQLSPWLTGRILAAHHVPTERTMLAHTFPVTPLGPWLDTLILAERAYPALPNHKLEELIPALGLEGQVRELAPEGTPHDAYYDACAAAVLARHIFLQPTWADAPLEALLCR